MKMLQVLNLTELELNRVDVRVGLSGALYYMDGSSQAVRQLRNLVSQVCSSLKCIFYSLFEIAIFHLHLGYSLSFCFTCLEFCYRYLYVWVIRCLDWIQTDVSNRKALWAQPVLTLSNELNTASAWFILTIFFSPTNIFEHMKTWPSPNFFTG